MHRFNIDFLGNRRILFAVSLVLIVVSAASLALRGLDLGIEFKGGTVINFTETKGTPIDKMRDALSKAGLPDAEVQSVEGGGYIIRDTQSDPKKANTSYSAVVKALALPEDAGTVTTIGPGWGGNITNAALVAAALSIAAILLWVSVRFEYKMSVTAVIALAHDALIVLGIYSLAGREVTPNTIAALLTILGYSLYDTIVVFHRIKENTKSLTKTTFMQMANESINQVFIRSINTSLSSLIPVVVLLFFGGETLQDFAFALVIGLVSGAYSSIAVASPIYAIWKETEPKFQALKKKYANA